MLRESSIFSGPPQLDVTLCVGGGDEAIRILLKRGKRPKLERRGNELPLNGNPGDISSGGSSVFTS